jgi:hypothetical protein
MAKNAIESHFGERHTNLPKPKKRQMPQSHSQSSMAADYLAAKPKLSSQSPTMRQIRRIGENDQKQ